MPADAYFFIITNPKKYFYTLFANIILFLGFLLLTVKGIHFYQNTGSGMFQHILMPVFCLCIFLCRFFFILTKKKMDFTNFHFAILLSVFWFFQQEWVPAVVILILGFLEWLVNKDAFCIIDRKGVSIRSFPEKKYRWDTLSNVILKDGIFTIDQKNNKLLQLDVSREIIPFSESSLKNFIAKQLTN